MPDVANDTHVSQPTTQDIQQIFNKKGCPCLRHGQLCKPPPVVSLETGSAGVRSPQAETLYVAGFVCKDFSILNPQRFTRDCVKNGNPRHFGTLEGVVQHIKLRQPPYFVLENVVGLRQHAHRCKSGVVDVCWFEFA